MGDSARKGKGQVEQHNFGKTDSNNPLVTRTCAFLCAEIIIESPAFEKHVINDAFGNDYKHVAQWQCDRSTRDKKFRVLKWSEARHPKAHGDLPESLPPETEDI